MHGMTLPTSVMTLNKAFNEAGWPLYVVGGAVRDHVLGVTPKDFDLACAASPEEVITIVSGLGSKRYPHLDSWDVDLTGKSFGVVRVRTALSHISGRREEFEIATFRKDVGAGRRPDSVVFTSIDEDVKRRDLTVNALFYDIRTEQVVDLVGGVPDIGGRLIRTVGDPYERFKEDPLRIMRALRFAARKGWRLDESTGAAIRSLGLEGVSSERIHDEFVRGFEGAESTRKFLNLYTDHDMWRHVFPQLDVCVDDVRGTLDLSILLAQVLRKNPTRDVAETLHRMAFTARETACTVFFMDFRDLSADNVLRTRRRVESLGLNDDQLLECHKAFGQPAPELMGAFLLYRPTVKGDDLLAQGYSGAGLGRELERRERELFGRLVR